MTFKDFIGIDPVDLPPAFTEELQKALKEMTMSVLEIAKKYNSNVAMSALQQMYVIVISQFFKRDPKVLREVAKAMGKGAIANMEVLIKNMEKE